MPKTVVLYDVAEGALARRSGNDERQGVVPGVPGAALEGPAGDPFGDRRPEGAAGAVRPVETDAPASRMPFQQPAGAGKPETAPPEAGQDVELRQVPRCPVAADEGEAGDLANFEEQVGIAIGLPPVQVEIGANVDPVRVLLQRMTGGEAVQLPVVGLEHRGDQGFLRQGGGAYGEASGRGHDVPMLAYR